MLEVWVDKNVFFWKKYLMLTKAALIWYNIKYSIIVKYYKN